MSQYVEKPGYGAPGPNSSIVALNDSGVGVGVYSYSGTDEHGYIAAGGGAQPVKVDFPTDGDPARVQTDLKGIDAAGDVFGNYYDTPSGLHAFARFADGTYVKLEGSSSIPDDLNGKNFSISAASASGEVTGTYFSKGATHLFTADVTEDGFADFKTVDLKDKDGKPVSFDGFLIPQGVNNAGDVVGYYDNDGTQYGFVEHNGTTTTLTPPSVDGSRVTTLAAGINNKGEVVGTYADLATQDGNTYEVFHGFTYTADGGYKELDVGSGFRADTQAFAVNDSGQVTGTYNVTDSDGNRRKVGFVLTGDDVTTIDVGGPSVDLVTINDKGLVGGDTYSGQIFAAVFAPDGQDSPPGGDAYSISASPDSVAEGTSPGSEGTITFTVTRSATGSDGSVQVDLTGTATTDDDYTVQGLSQDSRISFAKGESTKSFTVRTVPDGVTEADESVIATLSGPSDPGATLAQASATALIRNDDVPPPPPAGGGGGAPAPAPAPTPPAANPPTNNSINPPSNNTAAPTVTFDPTIAVAPGDVVTLSGTYTAAGGIGSIVVSQTGGVLGTATVNPNGTWSLTLDFTGLPGPHTGLTATATDAQGQTGSGRSAYNLITDYSLVQPDGYPYRTVQDKLDPATGAYTGSVFFNRDGSEYFESQYTADGHGGSTYSYSGGSFFASKTYSSFADHYDVGAVDIYGTDGALTSHATINNDGTKTFDVYAGGQTLDAGDPAAPGGTRFVFSPRLGDETVVNFVTGGPGHDRIDLGHVGAGRLTQILNHAHDDGAGNTVLTIGHGNTITLAGLAPGDLTRRDFALHA